MGTLQIVSGGRGVGKTTYLIELSATTGGTIVAPTSVMALYVAEMAKGLNKKIPRPIDAATFFKTHRYMDGGNYLFDNLDIYLDHCNITVASMDSDNTDHILKIFGKEDNNHE